jgi:putative nucleotidyltransferase with HDIG domain
LKPDEPERIWVRWLIAGCAVVVLSLLFPRAHFLQFTDLKEGRISPRRVVAPFDFEILKTSDDYARDRDAAVRDLLPVFVRDAAVALRLSRRVDAAFDDLDRIRPVVFARPERESGLLDSLAAAHPAPALQPGLWRTVLHAPVPERLNRLRSECKEALREVLGIGVLMLSKGSIPSSGKRIVVSDSRAESVRPGNEFLDPAEARTRFHIRLARVFPRDPDFAAFGSGLLDWILQPNLNADTTAYKDRVREVLAHVPPASGFVYADEKIVDKNERITPEIRQKLNSLATKMAERGSTERGVAGALPFFGRLVFVSALFFLLAVYVHDQNSDLLLQTKPVFLFALVALLVGGTAFILREAELSEHLVPASAGAMLLAALFDSKIAFAGTAVLSVLVGGLWGVAFGLTAVSFFTGVAGILVIRRVRSRSRLIEAVLIMVWAQVLFITILGLIQGQPMAELIKAWRFGALNGLFTPLFVYGGLVFFENMLDITTDFSLLELSNLNHPLLKRLSFEAPGTYHHSIMVGNLAEAAAQAVGANPLLARVGSYYHDVGKIEKAEYFVENQMRAKNPHRKLAPRMSALILANHVKQSLELADAYRLPSSIKSIMEQHHGRSIMSFFYQKAQTQGAAGEVNEEDYRYPGPRPQTKESAVVMLADSVEAASRSLKQPTHSRLKGLIQDIVDERFKSGELDESPLTLKDLERIKESFLAILSGNFHARVEYPEREPVLKAVMETERPHADSPHPNPPTTPQG